VNIYAIQDEAGFLKVGISKDHPARRVRELQTGNASALSLVGYGKVDGAAALERQIHRDLKRGGQHVRGEWFRPSAVMTCIANALSVGYFQEAADIAGATADPDWFGVARHERLDREAGTYDHAMYPVIPAVSP
jgi:hypothetical protein